MVCGRKPVKARGHLERTKCENLKTRLQIHYPDNHEILISNAVLISLMLSAVYCRTSILYMTTYMSRRINIYDNIYVTKNKYIMTTYMSRRINIL